MAARGIESLQNLARDQLHMPDTRPKHTPTALAVPVAWPVWARPFLSSPDDLPMIRTIERLLGEPLENATARFETS